MSLQNDDLRAVAVPALYEKSANDKTPMDLVSIGDTSPKYKFLLFRKICLYESLSQGYQFHFLGFRNSQISKKIRRGLDFFP